MAIPTDVAGLLAWHTAAGQPEAVGATVSKLIGLGGTPDGQVQSTAGKRPTKQQVRGVDTLRFDGTDDVLVLDASTSVTGVFTVFVAYAVNSLAGAYRRTLAGDNTGAHNWLIGARQDFGGCLFLHYDGGWVNGGTANLFPHVHTVKRTSAPVDTYYIDGVSIGHGSTSTVPGVISLGHPTSAEPADSDIYGVVVYNTALSDADRTAIEAYMATLLPAPMGNLVTQEAVEVVAGANSNIRTTQLAVEAVAGGTPNIKATQLAAEVVHGANSNIQCTQFCIEVVYANSPGGGQRMWVSVF